MIKFLIILNQFLPIIAHSGNKFPIRNRQPSKIHNTNVVMPESSDDTRKLFREIQSQRSSPSARANKI